MTALRRVSYLSLVLFLVAAQVNSAQQSALGTIVNAAGASMGSTPASAGSTVFGGEHFATGADGMLLIQIGAAQLYLAGASAATLRRVEEGAEASLEAGMLSVSSPRADALSIALGGATLRPLADVSSSAQTTLVEPRVYLLSILRGSWEFTYGCEKQTLQEGSAFRLYLDRTPLCPGDHNISQKVARVTRPGRAGILMVAIPAAAVTSWVLYKKFESPSRP